MSALRHLTYFGTTKLAAWLSLQDASEAIYDYRPRGWDPVQWFGNSQRAYALDQQIDQYNQKQWSKNPDPTSDATPLVNRGSTFVRNEHPLKLNLEGLSDVSNAAAIDFA